MKEGAIIVNTSAGVVDVPAGKFVQVESLGAKATVGDIPEGFFDLDLRAADLDKSWFQKAIDYTKDLIN